jgi:hypothetical protein
VNEQQALLKHFLAAIAYRTQKALRDAPQHYPHFAAGHQVRTPVEILRHMTSLMGYARTLFIGGTYPVKPAPLPTFADEIKRFHDVLADVGRLVTAGTPLGEISHQQPLQGPFADVMTHVGQLALLRRLADAPVAPENFVYADIRRFVCLQTNGPGQGSLRPSAFAQQLKRDPLGRADESQA